MRFTLIVLLFGLAAPLAAQVPDGGGRDKGRIDGAIGWGLAYSNGLGGGLGLFITDGVAVGVAIGVRPEDGERPSYVRPTGSLTVFFGDGRAPGWRPFGQVAFGPVRQYSVPELNEDRVIAYGPSVVVGGRRTWPAGWYLSGGLGVYYRITDEPDWYPEVDSSRVIPGISLSVGRLF